MKRIACIASFLLCLLCAQAYAAPGNSWTKNTRAGLMTFTEIDGVSNVRQFLGFYDGIAGFEQNGLWGAVNTQGNVVFDAYWDEMTIYSEGLAGVKKAGKWGCIDKEGYIAIDLTWDAMESKFSEGLRAVARDNLWGFIDVSGAVVIEPQFEAAHNFSEGLAAVKLGGQWGYIDRTGSFVLAPQWSGGLHASNPLSYGTGKNYEGSQIYGSYDDVGDFCFDRAVLTDKNGRCTLIDKQGNVIVPASKTRMTGFLPSSSELMLVYNGGIGFMNTQGDMVIPCNSEWQSGFGFWEGYACVAKVSGSPLRGFDYDYSYIDTSGKRLGQRTWDMAWSFLEGKAIVQKNGKLGYIDQTGEPLFDLASYDFITDFVGGYAMVLRNGKMVIIHCGEPASVASAISASEAEQLVLITNSTRVNVRQESDAKSEKVGMADSGKTYPCLSVAENGWFEIVLDDGTIGFISGKMGKQIAP